MKTASVSSSRLAIAALAAAAFSIGAVTTTTATAQSHDKRSDSTAMAPVVSGVCTTTATRTKVSKSPQSSTSTTFTDVADTQIAFPQGGSSPSCVIVLFSAEAYAQANTTMEVEALLDGSTLCQPSDTYFVSSNATDTDFAAHAMNYMCPNVRPGLHNIRIQFKSSNASVVTLDYRTTIVQYAK
jgi:hypothetical protein